MFDPRFSQETQTSIPRVSGNLSELRKEHLPIDRCMFRVSAQVFLKSSDQISCLLRPGEHVTLTCNIAIAHTQCFENHRVAQSLWSPPWTHVPCSAQSASSTYIWSRVQDL